MTGLITRFRLGRFIWTVLVTFYFLVFFRNFFQDALPGRNGLPLLLAVIFVLWLALEYYFGSPFFQSGVFEHSAFWRGAFAFFVYPYLGYVAADFIWWHWTQLPIPAAASGAVGLLAFAAGTFIRLDTLFGLLGIAQVKPAQPGKGSKQPDPVLIPEKKLIALRWQRFSRHPRYFGTFLQLVGAALVFRSWGGLVLALAIGLPFIWVQVQYEDRRLRGALKGDLQSYPTSVPEFWPRFGSRS